MQDDDISWTPPPHARGGQQGILKSQRITHFDGLIGYGTDL